MRVKDCKDSNCSHCQRRTWSQEYKPKNYHTIGFSHAYAWCNLHRKRVSEVKKCSEHTRLDGQINLFDDADKCVVCGTVIPEGRQVCPSCERMAEDG